MKELKVKTSTQKLCWDSENEIVWGELFGDQVTEELAKGNVDAQERVRGIQGSAQSDSVVTHVQP